MKWFIKRIKQGARVQKGAQRTQSPIMQANIVIGLFVAFYVIGYLLSPDSPDKKFTSFLLPAAIQTGVAVAVIHMISGGAASAGVGGAAGALMNLNLGDTVRKFSAARF